MASYRDEYFQAIDKLFDSLKRDPFDNTKPTVDPTPYESPGTPLMPAGWVENSDAKVRIDADGLHIEDGKIFIKDYSGKSVLGAAGFQGSWTTFIHSGGLFDADFAAGNVAAITAITETGGADTQAEYEASLSSDIPYWVISTESGAGTFERLADANAPSGFALRWSGVENAEIYQDIPISGASVNTIYVIRSINTSLTTVTETITYSFRDADHAIIGSENATAIGKSGITYGAGTYRRDALFNHLAAPANAKYIRVKIKYDITSGSGDIRLGFVGIEPALLLNSKEINFGELRLYTDKANNLTQTYIFPGGITFAGSLGTIAGTTLTGTGSNRLVLADGDTFEIANGGLALGTGSVPSSAFEILFGDAALRRSSANRLQVAAGDVFEIESGGLAIGTSATPPSGTSLLLGSDINLYRGGNNILATDDNLLVGANGLLLNLNGFIVMREVTAPGNAPTNEGRLFLRDNGAGKTQLCVIFNTGAIQVIATQP